MWGPCPAATYYRRINRLSDFHGIQWRSYENLSRKHEIRENWPSGKYFTQGRK